MRHVTRKTILKNWQVSCALKHRRKRPRKGKMFHVESCRSAGTALIAHKSLCNCRLFSKTGRQVPGGRVENEAEGGQQGGLRGWRRLKVVKQP